MDLVSQVVVKLSGMESFFVIAVTAVIICGLAIGLIVLSYFITVSGKEVDTVEITVEN